MKKMNLFSLLLSLLMLVCLTACAGQASAPIPQLEGIVAEITKEGMLITTEEFGNVMSLITEDTVICTEAEQEIVCGDYVYIHYDGKMTRSLPPQITAKAVLLYRLEGFVTEYLPEDNAALISTGTRGDVLVRLPEEFAGAELNAEYLVVYFDGAMMPSPLPGQVNAVMLSFGYALQGTVVQIHEDTLLLDEGSDTVQVNFTANLLPEGLTVGDVVRVIHNGAMTMSIPPQISAMAFIRISQ